MEETPEWIDDRVDDGCVGIVFNDDTTFKDLIDDLPKTVIESNTINNEEDVANLWVKHGTHTGAWDWCWEEIY